MHISLLDAHLLYFKHWMFDQTFNYFKQWMFDQKSQDKFEQKQSKVIRIDIKSCYLQLDIQQYSYCGAADALRPRARALAAACSLMSALPAASSTEAATFLNLARLRAAISSASSICFL